MCFFFCVKITTTWAQSESHTCWLYVKAWAILIFYMVSHISSFFWRFFNAEKIHLQYTLIQVIQYNNKIVCVCVTVILFFKCKFEWNQRRFACFFKIKLWYFSSISNILKFIFVAKLKNVHVHVNRVHLCTKYEYTHAHSWWTFYAWIKRITYFLLYISRYQTNAYPWKSINILTLPGLPCWAIAVIKATTLKSHVSPRKKNILTCGIL